MKVLNPRVGMLSNYEVLQHIIATKERYAAAHLASSAAAAMKAENLETVMREVKDYLSHTAAGTQSAADIDNFMTAMSSHALEKAELLQIINERPDSIAELDCIIEEMDARFDENTQAELLDIVKKWLPAKPKEPEQVNGD
ncbi:hypothetical protein EX30DRAFT_322428 [Ascodesmis nigricans]|uniref:DNA-directed RNA polymerase III subunit RPC9 n=1 Tax=Ascodesmis nigricans TaxID=341454 RepID=A0A4S2MMY9_9PEZI|nr:hypothetical protein EX30DRAFT_322428 [Ascodesmis nigricans]